MEHLRPVAFPGRAFGTATVEARAGVCDAAAGREPECDAPDVEGYAVGGGEKTQAGAQARLTAAADAHRGRQDPPRGHGAVVGPKRRDLEAVVAEARQPIVRIA